MSSPRRFAALFLSFVSLAGCSGADFGVSNPGLDAGDDAALDTTEPADTADSADSADSADASADAATADAATGDAAADGPWGDAADAPAVDTCAPNACGGCKALTAAPGSKCGDCGSVACGADRESVVCNDPGKNACGGCALLPARPGDACGVGCGGGSYKCNGTELLACDGATAANSCGGCSTLLHAQGAACGTCGTLKYACAADRNSTYCPADDANACGGCGALAGRAGDACGGCGKLACSGDKASLVCNDPGKNACGGCGTLVGAINDACGACGKLACSGDKASLVCSDPGTNACGGCGALPVPLGSVCGICGTSTVVCSAATKGTTCQTPDDRSKDPSPSQTTSTSSATVVDRITAGFLPFTVARRATRIATVSLDLAREAYGCEKDPDCASPDPQCTCNCTTYTCVPQPTLVPDGLVLELWTGTPTAPGTLLDTATLKPTDVPAYGSATPAPLTFSFAKDHALAPATHVFLKLVVTGPGYSYRVYGNASATTPSVPYWWQQLPAAPFQSSFAPYVVVTSYDCP